MFVAYEFGVRTIKIFPLVQLINFLVSLGSILWVIKTTVDEKKKKLHHMHALQ